MRHRAIPAGPPGVNSTSGLCSVRNTGPFATEPYRARVSSRMPIQRDSDRCSCSQKRPINATITFPEGRRRHDERQVGPRKRRHIGGEEADQKKNSSDDVQVGERTREDRRMECRSTAPICAMPPRAQEAHRQTTRVTITVSKIRYCWGASRCFIYLLFYRLERHVCRLRDLEHGLIPSPLLPGQPNCFDPIAIVPRVSG